MDTLKVFIIGFILIAFPRVGTAGERPKITEVSFKGNSSFSERTLKKTIVTKKSSIFKTRRFFREVFEDDLNTLRDFYTDKGYLSVSFTEDIVKDKQDNTVKITVKVDEGERFTFSSVMFLGNDFYTDEELLKKTEIKKGDYFSGKTLDRATSRLLSLYWDTGFSDIKINTDMNINSVLNNVSVDFFINEGNRQRINDILIRGNLKTQDNVVLRELTFKEGEYINFSRFFETRQKLMHTGLFKSVFIRPVPLEKEEEESKKNVAIELAERDSIEFGISGGYDTREYFWQKLEVTNRNLYGTSRRVGFTLRNSARNRRAEALISSPWNFGVPLSIEIKGFTGYEDEPGYDVYETGAGLSAGKTFRDNIRLSLSYDYQISEFKNLESLEFTRQKITKNIGTVLISRDTRNSIFSPSRGNYSSLKNEVIMTEFSLLKTSAENRFFVPLTSGLVGGTAISMAAIISEHEIDYIPPDERLYTGGPYSVRGYKYQNIGPYDSRGNPGGGKAELVWNIAELRLNIYKSFGIYVFTDTGNVWETFEEIDLTGLRSSAGGGLMLSLPIGVFRVEYGLKINKREDEKPGSFFFGSGMVF
ncbi:MAG: outer membrane protein assembly factor BamA [Elusimicrobiota bacterium]